MEELHIVLRGRDGLQAGGMSLSKAVSLEISRGSFLYKKEGQEKEKS